MGIFRLPFPRRRGAAEGSPLPRSGGERRVLESPAGCGVGPAERRGISSAASGRRAARATVAGFPAVGRGAPHPMRAEGAARSGCLGLHRAARARGPQPCSVSGLFTAPTALLRREDRRRRGGPLGKQDRRAWELRPAPGRGHRPRSPSPSPASPRRPGAPHKPRRGPPCRRDPDLARKRGPPQPGQEGQKGTKARPAASWRDQYLQAGLLFLPLTKSFRGTPSFNPSPYTHTHTHTPSLYLSLSSKAERELSVEFGEVMTHTAMLSHLAAAGQQRKCLQGGERQKEDTSLGGQKETEDGAPTPRGDRPSCFCLCQSPEGGWAVGSICSSPKPNSQHSYPEPGHKWG